MSAKSRKRKANSTHAMTAGTPISFDEPNSGRKPKPKVVYEINPANGFIDWMREHAIVGLAVGFVIATQVQALSKQLITSFIDPMYALFFSQKLSQKTFVLNWHDRSQAFAWGGFAYSLLTFLFVLLAVYILIKVLKLDDWDKPKKDKDEKK